MNIKKYTVADLQRATDRMADALDFMAKYFLFQLKWMSSNIKESNITNFDQTVTPFLENNSYYKDIWFINKKGVCIRDLSLDPNSKSDVGKVYSQSDLFLELKAGKEFIISDIKAFDEKYEINFALPVRDKKNNFSGVIGVTIDIVKLEELIKPKMDSVILIWLSDIKGINILYSGINTNTQSILENFTGSRTELVELKHNSKTKKLYKYKNQNVIICTSKLKFGEDNWSVSTMMPYAHIQQMILPFYKRIIILMLIITISIIVSTSIIISERLIIRKLKQKISKLEIIIDQKQKTKDIDDIVDNEYFRDLVNRAKELDKDDSS